MNKKVNKTVNLDLTGHNGNAFNLMGVFQRQAQREGWTKEQIDIVLEEARSGVYNHLLATLMNYCKPKEWKDKSKMYQIRYYLLALLSTKKLTN